MTSQGNHFSTLSGKMQVWIHWNYSLAVHLNYLGPVSRAQNIPVSLHPWIPLMLYYKGRGVAAATMAWCWGSICCLLEWQATFPFHKCTEEAGSSAEVTSLTSWPFHCRAENQIASDLRASWICRSRTLHWGWVSKPSTPELAPAVWCSPLPCRVGTTILNQTWIRFHTVRQNQFSDTRLWQREVQFFILQLPSKKDRQFMLKGLNLLMAFSGKGF